MNLDSLIGVLFKLVHVSQKASRNPERAWFPTTAGEEGVRAERIFPRRGKISRVFGIHTLMEQAAVTRATTKQKYKLPPNSRLLPPWKIYKSSAYKPIEFDGFKNAATSNERLVKSLVNLLKNYYKFTSN